MARIRRDGPAIVATVVSASRNQTGRRARGLRVPPRGDGTLNTGTAAKDHDAADPTPVAFTVLRTGK